MAEPPMNWTKRALMARENTRLLNRERSSIGSDTRSSQIMNATNRTTAATNPARIGAEVHPIFHPFVMARRKTTRAADDRAAPTQSNEPLPERSDC